MARMATQESRAKRARRQFTEEFKAGAVALVLNDGKTIAQVARDLSLTPSSLAGWVKQARGSQRRQDRAHHGGALRAREAPQGEQ